MPPNRHSRDGDHILLAQVCQERHERAPDNKTLERSANNAANYLRRPMMRKSQNDSQLLFDLCERTGPPDGRNRMRILMGKLVDAVEDPLFEIDVSVTAVTALV
jgi:hypothetical protein